MTKGIAFSLGAAAGTGADSEYFDKCMANFAEPLAEAAQWIGGNAAAGTEGFGWFNLPEQDCGDIKTAAKWLAGYDAIIHVGIGGSALGNLMLNKALLPEFYGELPRESRGPRFYLADNPDPTKALAIWERVKSSRVALVGVSKSGATAETMSQFLWFRERMEESLGAGKADENILVITDPAKGVFRAFAKATGCRVLDIPPSVGGRYSVLTACGLVAAGALGIDIDGLLNGAKAMKTALTTKKGVAENPAWALAAIHRFHEKAHRPMAVLMPYSSKLETFSEWFAQLWGESIGKGGLGTTPVRALGAIDQHSQVQLYVEGPDDKLFTIIDIEDHGEDIVMPKIKEPSLEPLKYLEDRSMAAMLRHEAMSTAAALVKVGRPVVWISLPCICAKTVGAMIFFYEYVTALTGRLMQIDPFDQPGVEQGKKYTYGLMGRDGFAADAEEANTFFGKITTKEINVN